MYYNDGDIMSKKINFRVMPKGYGKTSKEVREYINDLQDKLVKMSNLYFKMSERYEKLFNHYCLDIKRISKVNKAIEYVESFEYYIPEDNKEELIKILKGEDNE